MKNFEIGVMADSFRLGLYEGILKSREVGASGIQIYATRGEMSPENLSAQRRKEVLDIIRSNGLVVFRSLRRSWGTGVCKARG